MNAAVRVVTSACVLLVSAASLVGCEDDSSGLRAENSALRTQAAERTQTRQPVPTVDVSNFCQAVDEYRRSREALIVRFNELNATDEYFGSFTPAETQEVLGLEIAARGVHVPLPPTGSGDGVSRMNVLVLTLKSADERFVAAIRTSDYAAHRAAKDDSNAAGEELHQLYDSLCERAR